MNINVNITLPAAMNQKEAFEYVGGRRAFEILALRYPNVLIPIINEGKGRLVMYRRATIDEVVKLAEEDARAKHG